MVAFIFALFLIGLGNTVIRDLPKVEKRYLLEQFIDKRAATPIRKEIKILTLENRKISIQLEQAQLKIVTRQNNYSAAQTSYHNSLPQGMNSPV